MKAAVGISIRQHCSLLPLPLQRQERWCTFEPSQGLGSVQTHFFAAFGLLFCCSGLVLSGLVLQPVVSNADSITGEGMGQGHVQWTSDK